MTTGTTKILVVDDSALYRESIHNVLRDVEHAQVVGRAKNGIQALEKIEELDPDLLTLDVQMPDMDGIQLLREINRRRLRAKAIMVSSFTSEGAQETTDALMEGAFDFILKPSSSDWVANRRQLKTSLEEKITAFREASGMRTARRRAFDDDRGEAVEKCFDTVPTPMTACQAVIIGTSTGGPRALKAVLPKLPADLSVPVLVVQHMPPQYTLSLAKRLNEICELDVVEARDDFRVAPGKVMFAPGGRQMKLLRDGPNELVIRVTDDPPVHGIRPSVDYLIHSACEVLEGNVLAVIMTGMGRDGLDGCRKLKQAGGYVFAQHQDDCIVYGMPKAVIEEKLADRILPLGKVAPAIVRHLKRSRRTKS